MNKKVAIYNKNVSIWRLTQKL